MQHGTVGDVGDEGVDKAGDRVWIGFDVDIDAPLGSDGRGRRTDRGDDLRESVDPDGVDERIDRRTGGEDDGVCRSAGETTAVVDVGRDRAVGDDLVDVPAHHPQMDRQGLAGDLGSGEHDPTTGNRRCGERGSETLGDRIGRHEVDGQTERLGPIAGSGTDHCDPNAIGEWALTERSATVAAPLGEVTATQSPSRRTRNAVRSPTPPSSGSVISMTGTDTASAPCASSASTSDAAWSRGRVTTMRSPPSGPATTGSGGGVIAVIVPRSAEIGQQVAATALVEQEAGDCPTELIRIGTDPVFTDQDPAIKRRQHAGDLDAVVPKGCVCTGGEIAVAAEFVEEGPLGVDDTAGVGMLDRTQHRDRLGVVRTALDGEGALGDLREHDRRVSRSTGVDRSSARRSIAAAAITIASKPPDSSFSSRV